MGVFVGVGVGVIVGVFVGVGVGVGGACATSSVAGQFFPLPPTVLVMLSPLFSTDVRENDVPTATLTSYGDCIGAPSRTQISLSNAASQTTSNGSG